MRIQSTCLALLMFCALGTTPLAAAGDAQQKPPATTRPPAPPPTTATPAPPPAPTTAAQTPARPAPPAPRAAARRGRNSRGLITVSGLFQPATHDFTDSRDFSYNREPATTTGNYAIERGGGIDAGAFVRLWRNLGAGASVSSVVRTSDANFSGSYPHPFFFGRVRTAETSVSDLDRAEVGVHVSAAYFLPSTGRFGGVIYAGPSFFSIAQDAVESLAVTETYPYDTLTVAPSGSATELSESAVGFHVGADVAWYFSKRFGIGALARYTTAKTSVAIGSGKNFDLEAGGFQAGLGLRVRF
jgi:hypothetical protein